MLFEGLEGRIAEIVYAIPAVKGIEFALAFKSTRMYGSENNDEFYYDERGTVRANEQITVAAYWAGSVMVWI